MFCSTIIPTIGRPSLERAVNSVLTQDTLGLDHEVIVVNDSGDQLPPADWQRSSKVRVITTQKRNRSVARNTGAATAMGEYFHFLDDDDWMLPDAFQYLFETARTLKTAWVYGAFRLVDNEGESITEIYPTEIGNCSIQILAWEWLPLQASFISAEPFFRVGGFAPLPSLLGGFEDIDLCRQISLYGSMAHTNQVVASIRVGDLGSTTDYVGMFQQNRQSREKFLEMPGAFTRLRNSALSSSLKSSYWYGKVLYYYLASMKWNIRRKHLTTAASRLCFTLAGVFFSGRHFFFHDFWQGLSKPHYPKMGLALQNTGTEFLYAETRHKIMKNTKGKP